MIDNINKSIAARPNDSIWPGFQFGHNNTSSQQLKLHIFAANKSDSLDPDTDLRPGIVQRFINFNVISLEVSAIPQGKSKDWDFIVNITVSFK